MNNPKFALIDMDGTIINNHHVMHFDTGSEFKWEDFVAASMDAPVNEQVVAAINVLSDAGYYIAICTARPESIERVTIDHLEYLADNHDLHFDLIITRDQKLQDSELEELDGIKDVSLYKNIIHEHHAVYRNNVIDDLEERYGKGCVKYAFDDQEHNLNVMKLRGVEGYLIDVEGNFPEEPTHKLAGVM